MMAAGGAVLQQQLLVSLPSVRASPVAQKKNCDHGGLITSVSGCGALSTRDHTARNKNEKQKQRGGGGGGGGGEAWLSSLRNPAFHVSPALLSWATTPSCQTRTRKRRGALCTTAALGFEVTPATVIVLSSALSFAALRTYIYFQTEYIIAAMLGRHVPRGGSKVVELSIRGGRNLYYYPSDTVQVVAVSSKPNVQLLENQAVRAGVPIQIKTQGPSSLSLPSSSMDAVVSVFCFCDIADNEVISVLREAVRVLKPGKPFIFVENVGAKNPFIQGMQSIVGGLLSVVGSKRVITRDLLRYIQEVDDLVDLEYEEIFSFIDPHLVCVAKKKVSIISEPSKEARKGFKKSKA